MRNCNGTFRVAGPCMARSRYIARKRMGIFYVQYHAEPQPDSEEFESCGGAYVNCWVNASSKEEAQSQTAAAIAAAGWKILSVEDECTAVDADWYSDDDESREYYQRAVEEGVCYVFHMWPIEPQEDDKVH